MDMLARMDEAKTTAEVSKPFPTVPMPEQLTEAGELFLNGHNEVAGFILFVSQLVVQVDQTRRVAATALLNTADEEDTERRKEFEDTLAKGNVVTGVLRKNYRQLLFETALSRVIDNLLTYVAELMSTVFKSRPETLRSKAKVEVEYVLSHDSMDDLIEDLAERRVEQLAYAGLRELHENLEGSLGFSLFLDSEALDRAITLVEGRNIIVHNRGIVNRTYLSRVPGSDRKLGERLDFDVDAFFDDLGFLAEAGVDIDARAAEKWSIPLSDLDESHSKVGPLLFPKHDRAAVAGSSSNGR
jgi:hypothetical protein